MMTTVTETAAKVDAWIAKEYDSLKAALISNNTFDPDTFHDAYLSLYIAVTPDIDKNLYRKLFNAIYAEIEKNKAWQSFRSVNVQEIFFTLLKSDEDTESDEDTKEAEPYITAQEVKKYARQTLTRDQFSLFVLRFEHNLTYQQIGAYIGRGKDYAKHHTALICKTIKEHFNPQIAAV